MNTVVKKIPTCMCILYHYCVYLLCMVNAFHKHTMKNLGYRCKYFVMIANYIYNFRLQAITINYI